jgi:hypothetical protein
MARNGRGVADVEVAERGVVDQLRERTRGVAGPARREQVRLHEQGQGARGDRDKPEEQGRPDQGEREVPVQRPGARGIIDGTTATLARLALTGTGSI